MRWLRLPHGVQPFAWASGCAHVSNQIINRHLGAMAWPGKGGARGRAREADRCPAGPWRHCLARLVTRSPLTSIAVDIHCLAVQCLIILFAFFIYAILLSRFDDNNNALCNSLHFYTQNAMSERKEKHGSIWRSLRSTFACGAAAATSVRVVVMDRWDFLCTSDERITIATVIEIAISSSMCSATSKLKTNILRTSRLHNRMR